MKFEWDVTSSFEFRKGILMIYQKRYDNIVIDSYFSGERDGNWKCRILIF